MLCGSLLNVVDYATTQRELRAMESGLALWPDAHAQLVVGVGGNQVDCTSCKTAMGWKYLLGIEGIV